MNKSVHLPVIQGGDGMFATRRTDNWWIGPALTFLVLSSFVGYATFRVFENAHYAWGPYLSPMYSPLIETTGWGIPYLSPAMLILPGPLSFRFTCYYYRKAYYRSFAMTPPACAVMGRATPKYKGERTLMIFQNLHRYALYLAILFLVFLWHDVIKAFNFGGHFGIGMGTLVLALNTTLLSIYTFSCHSFRHLVGGALNVFSKSPLRYLMWKRVTVLNEKHMELAWVSLFGVALTDLYVRLVASGAITDIRIV